MTAAPPPDDRPPDDRPPADGRDDDTSEGRWAALAALEDWLDGPMLLLSFLWLVLVIYELAAGTSALLETFGTAIWVAFIAEFLLRLALAPDRLRFVARNWLTVIALVVPAFRLLRGFRLLRLARVARGSRLVRIVGTANRGMNALRSSLRRRGLGYVLVATLVVILLGAGGMLAFEPAHEVEGGFERYGEALWWTAMLLTSLGSEYWPRTLEGRILCFLLALYGLAVFGYITASFASFFVGQDAAAPDSDTPGTADLEALRAEIAALRSEIAGARGSGGPSDDDGSRPP